MFTRQYLRTLFFLTAQTLDRYQVVILILLSLYTLEQSILNDWGNFRCPYSSLVNTIMPLSPKVLLGLSVLTVLLSNVSDVTASLFTLHKRSPKVVSFDFSKQVPRNTLATRLRKRQKTVTADISNEQIAYVPTLTSRSSG